MIRLRYSRVAACSGYFSILLCVCTYACARTRYTLYHPYFATTATAILVVVLQLLAGSAAAWLALYIYSRIDSGVLLDLNCI